MNPDYVMLRNKLKKTLSPSRYLHTEGVEYTAAALAMCYGVEVYKAQLAGLLHDCAKEYPTDKYPKLCRDAGITLSEDELKSPGVQHAIYGPVVAKEKFEIDDPEILSAIRWHTTGKADMSILEKIIYVADYIEPNRKDIPHLDEIRLAAFTDLTYAVYLIAESTVNYLKKKGNFIEKNTFECYNWLKENGNHDKQ